VGHYFLHSGSIPSTSVPLAGYAEALLELAERYGFDGILVNLPAASPSGPAHRAHRGPGGGARGPVEGRERSTLPADDNPHHFRPRRAELPSFEEIDPGKLYYVEPWDLTGIAYPFTWGFEKEPRPSRTTFPGITWTP